MLVEVMGENRYLFQDEGGVRKIDCGFFILSLCGVGGPPVCCPPNISIHYEIFLGKIPL
jgi:hypothetical protein